MIPLLRSITLRLRGERRDGDADPTPPAPDLPASLVARLLLVLLYPLRVYAEKSRR